MHSMHLHGSSLQTRMNTSLSLQLPDREMLFEWQVGHIVTVQIPCNTLSDTEELKTLS